MERLDHVPNVVYHFSHPHPLELSNAQSLYTTSCSACKLQPHGWMYSCKPCNFTLHISCTQMPNFITHPSQQQQQRQQQQPQQRQQQASYQQTSGGHHGEDNGTLMHTMVQGLVEGVAHQVGETVAQSIINQDGGILPLLLYAVLDLQFGDACVVVTVNSQSSEVL